MLEDLHFRRESVVHVDAAVVGVSRLHWEAVTPDTAPSSARKKMAAHRFDVLPIEQEHVRQYYATERWGDFSGVSRRVLTHRDVIPFRTTLRDLIKAFATESHNFYFLGGESVVIGLAAVAGLNKPQVSIYVLSLLVDLEVRLATFLRDAIGDAKILEVVSLTAAPEKQVALQRYQEDVERGLDLPLIEYLYLSDLANIVVKHGLHRDLNYSRSAFKSAVGSLVDLRNTVAHPNRSLIHAGKSVQRLWSRLDCAEDMIFRLQR